MSIQGLLFIPINYASAFSFLSGSNDFVVKVVDTTGVHNSMERKAIGKEKYCCSPLGFDTRKKVILKFMYIPIEITIKICV